MSVKEFESNYLKLQEQDDVVVATFKVPRLTEEYNLEAVGHELFALVEQYGCRKLVVSMSAVEYVTSSGIGKMITLHRKMHRQQGEVIFCDVQQTVQEILRASKLNSYFQVAPDSNAALTALQGA